MDTEESPLAGIIREKIRAQGPIPFHEFMDICLYFPGLGYYTSGKNRIGADGDYYTSPWFSNLFGELIARQLVEMWRCMGKPAFTIIEHGGGNGSLCADILGELKKEQAMYRSLRYCIVEKKGRHDRSARFEAPGTLKWYDSLQEIPKMEFGCFLSNELVDNFPISQVVMNAELMEVYVDYNNGFVETFVPAAEPLKNYLRRMNVGLPRGYRTEINLQANDWLRDVSGKIEKGFVMTIDYGYLAPEYFSPRHSKGTLLCYHRHSVNGSPYLHIGEQDITAHVNFSALIHWGAENGLDCCGYTDQASFLRGLGLAEHLKKKESQQQIIDTSGVVKHAMMIHSFLSGMGRRFKVLVQKKGIQKPQLSGLRFCQPL